MIVIIIVLVKLFKNIFIQFFCHKYYIPHFWINILDFGSNFNISVNISCTYLIFYFEICILEIISCISAILNLLGFRYNQL